VRGPARSAVFDPIRTIAARPIGSLGQRALRPESGGITSQEPSTPPRGGVRFSCDVARGMRIVWQCAAVLGHCGTRYLRICNGTEEEGTHAVLNRRIFMSVKV
jgi:hypothetical protein